MNRYRILLIAALFVFLAGVWVLWVRPKPVDMAQYAPANSLIYIEINEPAKVLTILGRTDTWKLLHEHLRAPSFSFDGAWQTLIRETGIGPIDSVILSRSQIAIVVTGLNATESDEVLKVKPQAALVVETHTSEGRIREPIERNLGKFVAASYKNPSQERRIIDGVTTIEFREGSGSGQLVAAFVGSVAVIGNSHEIVQACVAVARRRAPSLRSNTQLQTLRASHDSANGLAFGYVPEDGSSKLLSAGVPIFFGQSPADSGFPRLVQNAASKLIGSISWTARRYRGGIEDRYVVDLRPDLVSELSPHFGLPGQIPETNLSADVYSVTTYQLQNPLAAFRSLKTSVSRRVDAVSAVLFNTTLKTGISVYGIDDPETFLGAVRGPLKTIRLDVEGERQLLVATVADPHKLVDLFKSSMQVMGKSPYDSTTTIMENAERTLTVAVNDSLIMIGHPVDVQQYYRMTVMREPKRNERAQRIADFVDPESRAHVVTYVRDSDRVRTAATAIARGNRLSISPALTEELDALPYATIETTLTERGFTRITRSPLGQFSALIPLLVPQETQP